ncbi:MAG TPA: ABC transporter permease [Bryobacteraceae bacterium]|nr:ABC transporter permease [Bryobacteraceae bacterium]
MTFVQDLRFAVRMLVKTPGFTVVVVAMLALGIGVNTTVFTLVNAVLFRGLPFEHADRVMHLSCTNVSQGRERLGVSYPDFRDWRSQSKVFEALAAFQFVSADFSDNKTTPERYDAARLSVNAFNLIGQRPILGRDFLPEEERPGAPSVCILGYSVWKGRYGGDQSILGKTIRINNVPTTIVGVMAEGMRFPVTQDLWLPLVPTAEFEKRDHRPLNVFGRLAVSATLPEARAEMDTITKRLQRDYAKTNAGVAALIQPYNDAYNGGPIRILFLALLGAVGFVLLIACANVANLLLARAMSRAREVSIRAALGASRWRVVRQLLIESVMLGVMGGVVSLAFSIWGVRAFDLAVANAGKPYWIKFTMDYSVFGYFAGISILTGIVFGLIPALHASKLDINEALKEGGRGSSGGSRMKSLSGALVVGELALALVLLSGAGLMVRSFLNLYILDLGVNTDNLLTMRYGLSDSKYPKAESLVQFHEKLLAGIRSLPGVESAAIASNIPMTGSDGWNYEVEGEAPQPDKTKRRAVSGMVISAGYFEACGTKIRRGRAFADRDGGTSTPTVIVNQRFAEQHWPQTDPLGRHLRIIKDGVAPAWLTVVGIAPNIVQNDPGRVEPDAIIYLPLRQEPLRGASVLARTTVAPNSLATAFRKEVQNLDSELPVFAVMTLQEHLMQARWPFRVFGSLFAIFAGIALMIAGVGIYATMAYSVNEKRQEIGVRVALGAPGTRIVRLVLSTALRQLAIGLVIGLAASFGVTRILKGILVRVSPTDPLTFTVIALLLCAIALVACWVPAHRATRIDPIVALRYQ